MSENEEKFDRTFSGEGGILLYESLNMGSLIGRIFQMLTQYLEEMKQRNSRFPLPHFFLINNTTLNAKVTKRDNEYYIGFNGGTLLLIDDLFHRMLSSSEVLPEYGDSSNESIEKIYNAKIADFNTWLNVTGSKQPVTPKDPVRSAIADHMTGIALRFLLRHEYAHIVNGHLDYIQDKRKLSGIDEEDKKNGEAQFSQTLEMDADSFATNEAMAELSLTPERLPEALKMLADVRVNLFMHAYSLYSLFRVFSNRLNNLESSLTYSHPPAVVRQVLILGNIATIFEKGKYGLDIDEASKICANAVIAVEKAFSAISEHEVDYDTYLSALTPQAQAYTRSIYYNWRNVRPVLEKYAVNQLPSVNY